MSLPNFIIEISMVLLFALHITKNIVTEVLIFYADELLLMGNFKNSRVFNFAILLKSRKLDACKIYMFYSTDKSQCFQYKRHVEFCVTISTFVRTAKPLAHWSSQLKIVNGASLETECAVNCHVYILSATLSELFLLDHNCSWEVLC